MKLKSLDDHYCDEHHLHNKIRCLDVTDQTEGCTELEPNRVQSRSQEHAPRLSELSYAREGGDLKIKHALNGEQAGCQTALPASSKSKVSPTKLSMGEECPGERPASDPADGELPSASAPPLTALGMSEGFKGFVRT